MGNALIVYASTHGHTARIAGELSQRLSRAGHGIDLVTVVDASGLDLTRFDAIVVGGSIRHGRHHARLTAFVRANRAQISAARGFFFSVSAIARKATKRTPQGNPYVAPFLARTGWTPDGIAVFAGKIDYPQYGFFDATVIRLIMKLTGGPTDPATATEFTDWAAVDAFASVIANALAPETVTPVAQPTPRLSADRPLQHVG